MRDIAEATGVSQSTVSRVLSDAPTAIPIAAATRERVLETAKRLGYRPNPLARGLMGARTMLLGAVIRDITDPSFPAIIEAVTSEARRTATTSCSAMPRAARMKRSSSGPSSSHATATPSCCSAT